VGERFGGCPQFSLGLLAVPVRLRRLTRAARGDPYEGDGDTCNPGECAGRRQHRRGLEWLLEVVDRHASAEQDALAE
jgi:hypothetical protein